MLSDTTGLKIGKNLVKAKKNSDGKFNGWQSRLITAIDGNTVTLFSKFSNTSVYDNSKEATIMNGVVFGEELFDLNTKEPIGDTDLVLTNEDYKYIHIEGVNNTGVLTSIVEGYKNTVASFTAHAEGVETTASGIESHAEGETTVASGKRSHAEGSGSKAIGQVSHAEGSGTQAIGEESHSEGLHTHAEGNGSHAEGYNTYATGP